MVNRMRLIQNVLNTAMLSGVTLRIMWEMGVSKGKEVADNFRCFIPDKNEVVEADSVESLAEKVLGLIQPH